MGRRQDMDTAKQPLLVSMLSVMCSMLSVSQIHKLHKKDELKFTHFVIMTDSITMGSVSVRYTIIIFMPEAGN